VIIVLAVLLFVSWLNVISVFGDYSDTGEEVERQLWRRTVNMADELQQYWNVKQGAVDYDESYRYIRDRIGDFGNVLVIDESGKIVYSYNDFMIGDAKEIKLTAPAHRADRYYLSSIMPIGLAYLSANGREYPLALVFTEGSIGKPELDPRFIQLENRYEVTAYQTASGWIWGQYGAYYGDGPFFDESISRIERVNALADQLAIEYKDLISHDRLVEIVEAASFENDEIWHIKGDYLIFRSLGGGRSMVLTYQTWSPSVGGDIRDLIEEPLRPKIDRAVNTFIIIGVPTFIFLLSVWVFADAKRRGFHPAMWGALALIGNLITLIIYMMVRPAALSCAQCGTPMKPEYKACPICGARRGHLCGRCGRPLDAAWKVCPYCGEAVGSGNVEPPAAEEAREE